jgi:hypothetical protein
VRIYVVKLMFRNHMDFHSIHLKISSLATSTMVKCSCNINTQHEKLVFNSDSEELRTSSVPDIECPHDIITQ